MSGGLKEGIGGASEEEGGDGEEGVKVGVAVGMLHGLGMGVLQRLDVQQCWIWKGSGQEFNRTHNYSRTWKTTAGHITQSVCVYFEDIILTTVLSALSSHSDPRTHPCCAW